MLEGGRVVPNALKDVADFWHGRSEPRVSDNALHLLQRIAHLRVGNLELWLRRT